MVFHGSAGFIDCANKAGSIYIDNCINNGNITGYAGFIRTVSDGVKNLTISNSTNNGAVGQRNTRGAGFISSLTLDSAVATIDNVINNGTITGDQPAGIIANIYGDSYAEETSTLVITNTKNEASVTSFGSLSGGLVAFMSANNTNVIISQSNNYGNISYPGGGSDAHGGIVGWTSCDAKSIEIIECNNYAKFDCENSTLTGGIVGYVGSGVGSIRIESCNNYSEEEIIGTYSLGGIVGYSSGGALSIDNCVSYSRITTTGGYSGGIAGQCSGAMKITNCTNKGDISTHGNSHAVGGIVGYLSGTSKDDSYITYCSNLGNITSDIETSSSICFGGIVGKGSSISLSNCTNQGILTIQQPSYSSSRPVVGGIAGEFYENEYNMLDRATCTFTGTIVCGTNMTATDKENASIGRIIASDDDYEV